MSYVSCAISFQSRLRILQYTRTTQQTTNRKERMMQYSCHKCGISDCYIYCHLMVANMMLATFNFSTVELEYFLPNKKTLSSIHRVRNTVLNYIFMNIFCSLSSPEMLEAEDFECILNNEHCQLCIWL